jgi:restriction system protein
MANYSLTNDLTLKEFLGIIKVPYADMFYYPVGKFPKDEHLNEFLATINQISEEEFRGILRHFVPKSCTYGIDRLLRSSLNPIEKNKPNRKTLEEQARTSDHHIKDTEYYKKLIAAKNTKDNVWEGLTWVLDLLPRNPNKAINALDAYLMANWQFLPDDSLTAIDDCSSMIRARYINKEHPREIFLNLIPRDFEKLVASMYQYKGYNVSLTKSSYDGGIDINAEKLLAAYTERIVIQCKNCKSNIAVDEVRKLLGVISDTKATKGILVTSSDFTKEAIKLAKVNPRIELINHKQLSKILNEIHGPYWIYKIESYIRKFI